MIFLKLYFMDSKKKNHKVFKRTNISKSNYYFGGGDFGFVGIKEGLFSFGKYYKLLGEFSKDGRKRRAL